MLAVLCSAYRFVVITFFGQLNEAWLRTFLALPNGSFSHDTRWLVRACLCSLWQIAANGCGPCLDTTNTCP